MKKLITFFILALIFVNINAQNETMKEAMKAASDMLYDVAVGKIDRFNWLSVEEIPQLFKSKNPRNLREWENFYRNPEKEVNPILQDIKQDGISVGIDWTDITITDIRYKGEYDEEWGVEEMKGYIFIKSQGKPFRFFFKRGFLLNGKWRNMLLRSAEQTSDVPSDYPKTGENK